MRCSVPITWNGIAPRQGTPDPLWVVLGAVLVLIADRGERLRWRGTSTGNGIEMWVLAKDTWFEFVPPSWRMRHLLRRLVRLAARGCWDWWRLWGQYRCHVRKGLPLAWERTVMLHLNGVPIPAVCRVHCEGPQSEVELAIPVSGEHLAAVAKEALPGYLDLMSKQEWDEAWWER